ncbi:MAG: hypothetical protein EOM14_05680 [Clostridia bacterium]|nr:hypothetical protein [Clostridia bacterium]
MRSAAMTDTLFLTEQFLRSVNMHPKQTDMRATMVNIMYDMERGLLGEKSSMPMIPTYISAAALPIDGEPVIVVDAGGTNLRVGLCTFVGGKPVLSEVNKYPIPGSYGEITSDEFFSVIAEKILPLAEKSSRIGMCFSYPAEIFPDRDGRIIQFNKELRVRGAAGSVLGHEIIKKLHEKGAAGDFSFTLLNDTTGGLMGCIAECSPDVSGGMAGLVVGTGCNCCYFESGQKIKKLKNAGDMIINCESGCFDGCFCGKADIITDEASEKPGDHLLEKMVSGAYLGTVITHTAELAAGAGLMSDSFISISQSFTLTEIDLFMRGEKNRVYEMCSANDVQVLRGIVDLLFERAARIVCAMIAAVCVYSGGGKTVESPFVLVPEGSTFWNSLLFWDKFTACVDSFITGELGRHLLMLRADYSTLEGAALSVFTL